MRTGTSANGHRASATVSVPLPHPKVTPANARTRPRPARSALPQPTTPSTYPGTYRGPVTEFDELQELEAARERNDLDVSDLRAMSVTELRSVEP